MNFKNIMTFDNFEMSDHLKVFNSSLFHILHDGLAPELLTGIGKTGRVGGPFLLITNLFAVLSKSSWLFLFNGIVLSTEGW